MIPAESARAADLTEDIQETGISTWATVQAALLSAIPFGLASVCMLVSACTAKQRHLTRKHTFLGSNTVSNGGAQIKGFERKRRV